MIRPSDIIAPAHMLCCGMGQVADGCCCLFTLTRYRSHLHEKFMYQGEAEAESVEWIEPATPVSTLSYLHNDTAYRTSRTHSRLPLALLALSQIADGLIAITTLGMVHSTLVEKLQFSEYWADATQPWFRVHAASAVSADEALPLVIYMGVEKH